MLKPRAWKQTDNGTIFLKVRLVTLPRAAPQILWRARCKTSFSHSICSQDQNSREVLPHASTLLVVAEIPPLCRLLCAPTSYRWTVDIALNGEQCHGPEYILTTPTIVSNQLVSTKRQCFCNFMVWRSLNRRCVNNNIACYPFQRLTRKPVHL
jgi:hypothetical protein